MGSSVAHPSWPYLGAGNAEMDGDHVPTPTMHKRDTQPHDWKGHVCLANYFIPEMCKVDAQAIS
jgi:hypothetical protein